MYIDTHQQNNRYFNNPMFSSVKEYMHICAFILKFYLSLECIYLLIYFLIENPSAKMNSTKAEKFIEWHIIIGSFDEKKLLHVF